MRVAEWAYDWSRGGTEGQCARVCVGLAERGWTVRPMAFRRQGFFIERLEKACGGSREVRIRHAARPGTLAELVRVAKWLRAQRIDLLHTWDADAAVFGQFAAQLAGIPLVTSRRDLGAIYPAWKQSLLRRADRRAMKVVVNAEAVRAHFLESGVENSKMVLIPNILDLRERDREAVAGAAVRPEGAPDGIDWSEGAEWRLAVVNRLDPEKNTGLLLKALAGVLLRHPEARLWVVGDGVEREPLESLANELQVRRQVVFWGERNDVTRILRHVRAGALVPKANEGLSNTILEYMAASLPVLATDCGGNRELVEDGVRGRLLAASATPVEVAEAWSELIGSEAQALAWGTAARTFVETRFTPESVIPRFEAVYRQLEPVVQARKRDFSNIQP